MHFEHWDYVMLISTSYAMNDALMQNAWNRQNHRENVVRMRQHELGYTVVVDNVSDYDDALPTNTVADA